MLASRNILALVVFILCPIYGFNQVVDEVSAAEARAHAARQAFIASTQTNNYDVVYHRAEWSIDPAIRYIRGAITTHFTPLEPLNNLWFDLDNTLLVDSVYYRNQKISFDQSPDKLLRLDFPQTLATAKVDSVTVFYQGVPPTTGYGSFEQSMHTGAPIVWTLSEPYGARDWWPCKQSLTDKIDSIDIVVRTPLGNRAASNGKLLSEEQFGQQMVYRWQHRYPIATYLVAVAVTNYVAFGEQLSLGDQQLEILNYAFPESESQWRSQAPQLTGMMELFSNLFGTYPFMGEKYGHAQFGWGGGMEHQTMSFMQNLSNDLMAHELAHQWFGNKVTCGSWQHIWVNEGFATYLTGLTKEKLGTPTDWKNWKTSKINSVTSHVGGSVWVPETDTTNVGRIFNQRLSYNKGAYLLHMLRWITGDEAFFTGIRSYLNNPDLQYGFATAADVQRHLEASSGKDLEEFFNDWYYGEGYPSWNIQYKQEGNSVTLTLNQTTSVPQSVPFFEMPVPILFRNSLGTQEALHIITHTSQQQEIKLEVPFEIGEAIFDPHQWLLTRSSTISQGVSGLEDLLASKILVHPNPAASRLVVEATGGVSLQQVQVLSLSGIQLQAFSAQGEKRLEVNLKALPIGTYLLHIQTDQGWTSKRFTRH